MKGCSGPARRAGLRSDLLPDVPIPVEGTASAALRLLLRHASALAQHLERHQPRLRDVELLAKLLNITRDAHALESEVWAATGTRITEDQVRAVAADATRRHYPHLMLASAWQERLECDAELRAQVYAPERLAAVLAADPELATAVALQAGASLLRRAEPIVERLLADEPLRVEVMHGLALERARREREAAVPDTVAFDADGRVVPVDRKAGEAEP